VRVYLVACLASVVICIGGYFALNAAFQEPTGIVYATDGARISPHWVWRSVLSPSDANELTRKGNSPGSRAGTGPVMADSRDSGPLWWTVRRIDSVV
jgi:hypothetical protein